MPVFSLKRVQNSLDRGHRLGRPRFSQNEAAWATLRSSDCILVPGGFGDRGMAGKLAACHYARTNGKPFLGICLGFQMAVIEYARDILGLKEANSMEMNAETSDPVVIFMPEGSKTHLGGTMRLGTRKTVISGESKHALPFIEPMLLMNVTVTVTK